MLLDGNETTAHRRGYLEQELLELSAVAIPAHANAGALGLKSGAVEHATLAETLDLLQHASPHTKPTRPHSSRPRERYEHSSVPNANPRACRTRRVSLSSVAMSPATFVLSPASSRASATTSALRARTLRHSHVRRTASSYQS